MVHSSLRAHAFGTTCKQSTKSTMPKLTKEEKKRRRIEKKLQKKLAAEEKKKKLRRDHLQRETEHTELNLKTLKKKWRDILLELRLPEFRQDVETMWHKFDRALDLKNYIISCLLDEIDQDEQQYNTNLGAHVEAIDKLIVMFATRWDELQTWYRREVAGLRSRAKESSTQIANQLHEDTNHIKMMLFAQEQAQADADYASKGTFMSKTTEESNNYAEMHQMMRSNLEHILEEMWTQFKLVLLNYQTSTHARRKAYLELKARDEQGGALVLRQMRRTNFLYNLIRTLRDRLQSERIFQDNVLADFRYERKFYAETYCKLRSRLKEEREHDHSQLLLLTVSSNESMKHLQQIATKGEHILKVAAICRKMETQDEKVTPFPRPFLSEIEEENLEQLYEPSPNTMLKAMDDVHSLEQFWRRVAEADLKRLQLRECLNQVQLENQYLRHTLKRVMGGLAISENVSVVPLQQSQKRV